MLAATGRPSCWSFTALGGQVWEVRSRLRCRRSCLDWPGNMGFKAYGYADKDRIPREQNVAARSLNQGSTLLIFREAQLAEDSTNDFRPNFRNLRSKVRVRARRAL
jgi:hypothetical protein